VLARRAGRDWFVGGDVTDTGPNAGLDGSASAPAGQGARTRMPTGMSADATRIDAAALVELVFTTVGRATFERTTTRESLVRNPDTATALPPILAAAFGTRTSMPLGRYDPAFGAAWKLLRAELLGWRKLSGFWDPASTSRKTAATIFGLAGLVAGVVGVWLVASGGSTRAVAPTALVGGLGLAGLGGGWELLVRTPAGSATWLQVESFRRFLHDAEGHDVDPVAEQGRLREYTAWAVALGEIDRWQQAMALSSAAPRHDADDHAAASGHHAFATAVLAAATAPSAPPSTT
jgi:hypothetical protein